MNIRDRERDLYVYEQRKQGKLFREIAVDLGITGNRVRQIYRRIDWEINRENSDGWQRDCMKHLKNKGE